MTNESFLGLRNSCLPFLALSLVALAVAQDKHGRVGEIEFYGYAGFDPEKVRAALPLREGDDLGGSDSAFFETTDRIRAAITKVIGKPPTDIAVVCCDDQGGQMIYIGLPGKSMRNVPYNPPSHTSVGRTGAGKSETRSTNPRRTFYRHTEFRFVD
jgi:hypothetical protein